MWRKTKRSEILETDCVKKFGIFFIMQKLEVILGILDSKKMRCGNVKN